MKRTQFKNAQSGFTLIELVVVIVILGILAATAIPRFTDMSKDARKATVNGLYAAIQSAIAVSHAQALAQGVTGSSGTITMEGQSVKMVYGYPDSATGGIDAALSSYQGFTYTTGAASSTFVVPTYTAANCGVTYNIATSSNAASATVGVANCS